jgi:hypothetical protein
MIHRTNSTSGLDGNKILDLPLVHHHNIYLEPESEHLELVHKLENDMTSNVVKEFREAMRKLKLAGSNPKKMPTMPIASFRSKLWERRPAFIFPFL